MTIIGTPTNIIRVITKTEKSKLAKRKGENIKGYRREAVKGGRVRQHGAVQYMSLSNYDV